MEKGFAIVAVLFGGLPFFFWIHATSQAPPVAGVNLLASLALILTVFYGLGWIFGYAVKKIRHG